VQSWSTAFPADDERLLGARRELARCLERQDRSAESRAILEAIYPLYRAKYGDEHADTAALRESLEIAPADAAAATPAIR
jgi:hypothetical protein